jgi:hypothetical protein
MHWPACHSWFSQPVMFPQRFRAALLYIRKEAGSPTMRYLFGR